MNGFPPLWFLFRQIDVAVNTPPMVITVRTTRIEGVAVVSLALTAGPAVPGSVLWLSIRVIGANGCVSQMGCVCVGVLRAVFAANVLR
jgi:hypothetical protein